MPSYNSSFLENYMQQQQQQQEQNNNIKVVLASNNNNNTSNNHLNIIIPPYSPRSKRSNSLSVNVDVMSPRRYRSASLSRPNIQLNNQCMTTKSIVVTGPPTNKRLDLRVHVHKRQQSLSAAQDIVMSGQLSPLPTPLSAIAAFTFDVSQIRSTATTGASSVASTVNSVGSSTDMKTPHSAPALPHYHHHRRNFFSFDSAASSLITPTTSVITPNLSSSPSSPSTYFKSNKQMFNPKRRQSTVGQELDFVESSGAAVESEELNTSSIDLSLSDLSLQQPQQPQPAIIDHTQFTFDEDFEHHHHHAEDSHTDSVDSDHEAHEEPSASTSTGLSRPVSMPSFPLNENVIEFEQVKQLERRERVTSPTDAARRYTMGAIRFSKRIEKQTTKSKPARFAKRVAKGVHDFFDSHTWILG